jgi:hypothetical protein
MEQVVLFEYAPKTAPDKIDRIDKMIMSQVKKILNRNKYYFLP